MLMAIMDVVFPGNRFISVKTVGELEGPELVGLFSLLKGAGMQTMEVCQI